MHKLLWLLLVPAGLLLFGLGGCGDPEAASGTAPPEDPVLMLSRGDVAPVVLGDVETGPAVSGVLAPSRIVDVKARIAGDILAVHVREGAVVRKGQSLAEMDTEELGYQLQSAEAELAAAEAVLKNARNNLERTKRLVHEGAMAPRDLETAEADRDAAGAQQALKRARVHEMRKTVSDARFPAPISGVISRRMVEPGDHVDDGDVMMTVVDPRVMELTASIASDDLGSVSIGLPIACRVEGYRGRTFEGTIARINPGADPATRQVTVYVRIPNPTGELIGGLFATGRIITGRRTDCLLVPNDAIRPGPEGHVVYRIADGTAAAVPVTPGIRDPATGMVAVTGDLGADDLVLVGPTTDIPSGARVSLAADSTGRRR